MDRSDPAWKGRSEYTPLLLRLYDPLVLGPVARFVWRSPTTLLLDRYRSRIRPNHLDVGPGTGYFLDHSGLPDGSAVTILDPNPNVLAHTSARLGRFRLTTVEADVLKPLPVAGPYDSAALHMVIHCLRGPMDRKAPAVANVAATLAPDGLLFGGTVLGTSARHTRVARGVLRAFNWNGGFDNLGDSADGLREILEGSFERVEIELVGSIALFAASIPRRTPA